MYENAVSGQRRLLVYIRYVGVRLGWRSRAVEYMVAISYSLSHKSSMSLVSYSNRDTLSTRALMREYTWSVLQNVNIQTLTHPRQLALPHMQCLAPSGVI